MPFKKNILKKYIDEDDILHIIGHDSSKYIKVILKYLLFLVLLFFVYKYSHIFLETIVLNIIFGLLGLILYAKFTIDFLDIYLDAIILTKNGLVIFKWDGLLKNSSETIQRGSVDSVYDEQSGLLDAILNKGDIIIKRGVNQYIFQEIRHASKEAEIIMEMNEKMKSPEPEETPPELDKFDILVETLGEVIKDYMQNSKEK